MGTGRHWTAAATLLALAVLPFIAMPLQAGADSGRAQVVWEGDVYLNDTVIIEASQTLTIRPGTTVHVKGLPYSCTEGNKPLLAVNGSLNAEGTPDSPVRFISGEDGEGCSGREAVAIYTADRGLTSVISNAQFLNGTLMVSGARVIMRNSTFSGTYLEFWKDRSLVEDCILVNSPIYIYHESSTVIRNSTLRRDLPDEVGIHPSEGVSVLGNRISGCFFGIEAPVWISAEVRGNAIADCTEGIHSFGNLTIEDNIIMDNGVGINSSGGTDHASGNSIAGNDIGVTTFGDPKAFLDNTYIATGARNRRADIRQQLTVQGKVVDGNGLELKTPVRIADSSGDEVYYGDPGIFILTRYERAPDGAESNGGPFTASARFAGASNSTIFDGVYQASFALRLELLPELSVSAFTGLRPGLRPGDDVTFNVTIRNSGNVAAAGFDIVLTIDGQPSRRTVRTLAAGEDGSYEFCWTAEEGGHRFVASVDSGAQVREPDEGDNQLALGAEVAPAPALPPMSPGLMLLLLIGAGGGALLALKR